MHSGNCKGNADIRGKSYMYKKRRSPEWMLFTTKQKYQKIFHEYLEKTNANNFLSVQILKYFNAFRGGMLSLVDTTKLLSSRHHQE